MCIMTLVSLLNAVSDYDLPSMSAIVHQKIPNIDVLPKNHFINMAVSQVGAISGNNYKNNELDDETRALIGGDELLKHSKYARWLVQVNDYQPEIRLLPQGIASSSLILGAAFGLHATNLIGGEPVDVMEQYLREPRIFTGMGFAGLISLGVLEPGLNFSDAAQEYIESAANLDNKISTVKSYNILP